MLKHIITPIAALAIFMASGITQVEAKRVKERADLSISFQLLPNDVQPEASGSADIELNRESGEEEAVVDFNVEGLTDGTYTINAITGAAETVKLTDFVIEPAVVEPPVEGAPVDDTPEAPETENEVEGEIELPEGLNPLQIVAISVVDANGVEVLRGEATSNTTYWMFKANVKVTGPTVVVEPDPTEEPPTTTHPGNGKGKGKDKKPKKEKKPKKDKGVKGPKAKKVHGHVLVQSLIVGNQEKKRKFLFNAQGAPANTELTLNVDGTPVETVTSSHKGKVFLKSLDKSVRLAGISEITITDAEGNVIMEAQF